MSLLDKAKAVPVKASKEVRKFSDEEVELAVAVAKGEVTTKQAMLAIGMTEKSGAAFNFFHHKVLEQAVRDNRLVLNQ